MYSHTQIVASAALWISVCIEIVLRSHMSLYIYDVCHTSISLCLNMLVSRAGKLTQQVICCECATRQRKSVYYTHIYIRKKAYNEWRRALFECWTATKLDGRACYIESVGLHIRISHITFISIRLSVWAFYTKWENIFG